MNEVMNAIQGVKSLKSILSSFHKVIEDLQKLQQENENRIVRNDGLIAKLRTETDALAAESGQAAKIQENISKLLE